MLGGENAVKPYHTLAVEYLFAGTGRGFIMAKKRPTTIEACKRRNNRVLRLDHAELFDEDIEWLAATERLTLWNVKVPTGLLARIEKLWWLGDRSRSCAGRGQASISRRQSSSWDARSVACI
jgi:hypothetical protein